MQNALPPGLAGFVAAQQLGEQGQARQLGMLAQLLQMQGAGEDRQIRQQMLTAQMEAARVKAAREEALRGAKSELFVSPAQSALTAGAAEGDLGPTVTNAARTPPAGPALNPQAVARYLALGGDPKTIEAVQNLGPRGQLSKIDPKDYTPESFSAFLNIGNPAVLRPRVKMEVGPGGQAYDPYALTPGTVMADPNKPFAVGPNGPTPNLPFQQYEINKARSGASKTNVTVNPMRETFKDEQALRKEYTDSSGAFTKLAEGYSKVKGALSSDPSKSAPATLAAATQFMKMLDPESVVRESELGMALSSAGVWDRFTNLYNTVQSGRVLTPNQAAEFGRIADVVYGAANQAQQKRVQHFRGLAQSYNFNPDRVVPDLTPQTPQRRSSDGSPVRKYNPATGMIE
jgi:hypothetical protein